MSQKETMIWERSILNTKRREEQYRHKQWIITWNPHTKEGYISKLNRVTVIDTFSKEEGYVNNEKVVPKYVIEQINSLLSKP